MHHRAKCRQNRSNCDRDMAIFRLFQDGGRRHLGFLKFQIFNRWDGPDGRIASSRQFHQNRSNRG